MKDIRNDLPHHFLFAPGVVINTAVEESKRETSRAARAARRKTTDVELPGQAAMYLAIVGYVRSRILRLLEGVSYIGPLRERPKRIYQLSGEPPADVGLTGQFAPEILFRDTDGELQRQVDHWLREFGLAHSLRCRPVGDSAFMVTLRRTQSAPEINLADTGFGISQVLPLIVEAIYGTEHTLTVAEQPEIHLNPKLQTRLADLFVEVAAAGRSLLVETHSEHFVLRLRRLIAEGAIRTSDVAIYFVEKVRDESQVREVPITEDGHAEAWPKGFFEDALDEAMGLAAAQIRRTKTRAR